MVIRKKCPWACHRCFGPCQRLPRRAARDLGMRAVDVPACMFFRSCSSASSYRPLESRPAGLSVARLSGVIIPMAILYNACLIIFRFGSRFDCITGVRRWQCNFL